VAEAAELKYQKCEAFLNSFFLGPGSYNIRSDISDFEWLVSAVGTGDFLPFSYSFDSKY
jgi:hypothetical protein